MQDFFIDPQIERARTPPPTVYHDRGWFDRIREQVLARGWHSLPGGSVPVAQGEQRPWTLLPGVLDEPLLLVRGSQDELRCLSNVCTHRGNLLVPAPCRSPTIRCGYHGRRFRLDGTMSHAPGFDAHDPGDDLPSAGLGQLGPVVFVGLDPVVPLGDILDPVAKRVGFLPLDEAVYSASASRTYEFEGNWILYCDNYLEGFHIPFVHPALDRALEFGAYRTELLSHGVVQIGIGSADDGLFQIPPDHPDHGQRVAAYYFWLFPTTMVNVYPWGLSINAVLPLEPTRTRVEFSSYVWDESARDRGVGADLNQVELEDEAVVVATQRGVRSRLYRRGRYAPKLERGVHHFHRMLAAALGSAAVGPEVGLP